MTLIFAAAGVLLLAYGSVGLWYRVTGPAIPSPDTTNTDPAVVTALSTARRSVERRPGSADTWGHLGKVLRIHEFFGESDVCFARAAELNPRDPRWPYFLGRGQRGRDREKAEQYLKQSVALGGNVFSPHFLLGELLLDEGRIDEAEPLFTQILAHEPGNPRALFANARIAVAREKPGDAIAGLERVVAAAPTVKAAHSLLAQLYARQGRKDLADREAAVAATLAEESTWIDPYQQELVAVWTGLEARLAVAQAMWSSGEQHQTIPLLRAVVNDYPSSARAQFVLGDRLNRLKEFADAEAPLREAGRIDPDFSRAHFELGYSLQQQGKVVPAADAYREAIRLQPDFALAYYDLSYSLATQRDIPGAIAALQDAVRYGPGLTPAYARLADLLRSQGREREARDVLDQAAALRRPASAPEPAAEPETDIRPPEVNR
ncbi:MAG TPA: tetratricopeptide repeat protein [Vicinamibacterales bacterium]|nr:tetratricopeptide repeat protein [Vicinamibacterales bacterium]